MFKNEMMKRFKGLQTIFLKLSPRKDHPPPLRR
jgi:hypothetical protein